MATTEDKSILKPGLILNVEVEDALDGVVMVCLRHEGRTLRGILLDSDKGSCPVGLPSNDILRRDLNDKFGVPENEIATIEADIVKRDPHSALSYRQSYFQNMPLPPPRPLLCGKPQPSPKPKLGPSYTTRTRPLKLRPRQILCSNCKQDCSKKNTTKRKLLTNGGNLPKKKSRLDPLKKHAPHGLKKRQIHSLKKTLKISYATPQGKDHVTISPRSSGNDKRVNNTQPNGKKVNGIPKGAKHTKQDNGKPQIGEEKEDVSVEKEKENENSLSAVAAKEVLTNSLKVHLVEDLFVPCSKRELSDTSSESSYSSSVSSKRSRKNTGVAPSDFLKQETNDSDREIEFKDLPPDRSDILSSSNENLQPRKVPPLNLKIHKKNVTKYRLQDGRTMCLGDIVWGKIIGFPWWPGRISQIVVSRRDNGAVLQQEAQIRWLGATTISHMPLEKLYPFLPYFKERYNKKRRGVYKNAISEAMEEAKSVSTEVRELNTMFETSQIC
ncbi:putative PWWP domain-containing protein 2A isoform X1 [Apostichopus japonicus]|uniref:Putative PWWP domain-containing protein 2A isoform X1 n=1 Tax=Stichopus japonicus TaxID=307972 RepID=A0A2G8KLI3_STIJA|nr:putative PWWP domain-containing protein 2A isoform X1 [Apostichopus japonicus]